MVFKKYALFSIFVTILISSGLSMAFVYQCVGENGKIEYKDIPCNLSLQSEHYLPIQYTRILTSSLENNHLSQETLNQNNSAKSDKEAINKEKIKKYEQTKRKEEKLKAKQEKMKEQLAIKAKRKHERCAKLHEKIQRIESELRLGCKLKRFNRLKEELNHCKKMQDKYCKEKTNG